MDKGNGDFTFDFRSFESGGGEGGTGDADGDGTPDDPFANPDGGPLTRIEAKLDKMAAEKAAEADANAVKKFDEPASPDGSWKEAKPSQVNGGDSEVSDGGGGGFHRALRSRGSRVEGPIGRGWQSLRVNDMRDSGGWGVCCGVNRAGSGHRFEPAQEQVGKVGSAAAQMCAAPIG